MDVRKLRPIEVVRLVNSTPLGTVLSERRLRGDRAEAGYQIGDGKSIDLLRYVAWHVAKRAAKSNLEATPAKPNAAAEALAAGLRNRLVAAQRSRDKSTEVREIGELPAVVHPERRAKACKSFRAFCEAYLKQAFTLKWSPDHLRVIAKIERVVRNGELFAIAMPRGSGKTTLCEAACLWALLIGAHRFVVLIGATMQAAKENLKSIQIQLETNDLLLEDFPEVCYPIQKLEGIHQRKLLYRGEPIRTLFTKTSIVLPTIPGSQASGGVIRVAGIMSSFRGMKATRADGDVVRPTMGMIDDPQNDRSAKSEIMNDAREQTIAGSFLGLPGPGKRMAGLMCVTVIERNDVAERYLDRKRNPAWQGERCQMVYQWPTNEELWSQYAELREEGLQNEDGGQAATAYYKKNRKAMDAGARVAWPERYRDGEISALQYAMNLRIDDARRFASEYQNDPVVAATSIELATADEICARVNRLKRGLVPEWAAHLVLFIDVQQKGLYWVKMAFAEDFTGAVLDYSTWPEQGRSRFTAADMPRTLAAATKQPNQEGQIYAGLTALCDEQLGREWPREGGGAARVTRCAIDSAWGISTDVVYLFCRQSPFASLLIPSRGIGISAHDNPLCEGQKKPGEKIGLQSKITRSQKRSIPYLLYDTNYWKSFTQARLRVGLGNRGALSLFGADPNVHRFYAEHLTSEFAEEAYGKGRMVWVWKLLPGKENHWLDGTVACHVLASMQGAKLLEVGEGRTIAKAAKERLRLSEIQAAKRRGR